MYYRYITTCMCVCMYMCMCKEMVFDVLPKKYILKKEIMSLF